MLLEALTALFSCLLMIRKRTSPFGKDLRYLSRRSATGKSRLLAHPAHWVATLTIAVAIGIWLGSSPDAAVERPSPTLKKQIELVLEQDPIPASETLIGTGVRPLPAIESFQGVAAIKNPAPTLGLTLTPVSANKESQQHNEKKGSEHDSQSVLPDAGVSETQDLASPTSTGTASRADKAATRGCATEVPATSSTVLDMMWHVDP